MSSAHYVDSIVDLRHQLGDFIRIHRQRITPESAGYTSGGRRRTSGLRREELAQLCRVSLTWITWLEQGRDVAASPAVLARLAQALQLTTVERAYLFELAARPDPEILHKPAPSPAALVLRSVEHIACPAYVLDRGWNIVAANTQAQRLFLNWNVDLAGEANLLRYLFLSPQSKSLIDDWEGRCWRLVAEFRADCGRHSDEPAIRMLIDELSEKSPDFSRFWQSRDVREREGGVRRFHHPQQGELTFEQITLKSALDNELKLVMLLPVSQ